jgi:hypothetical protein
MTLPELCPLRLAAAFALLALASGPSGTTAAVCPVPSAAHPTIGAAVRDTNCTTAELAAGEFTENVEIGRDLMIEGAGSSASTIHGGFSVSGADVRLAALAVDGTGPDVAGCFAVLLDARDGAQVSASVDVAVFATAVSGPRCRIFSDGFEGGSTLAWSVSVP